MSECNHKTCSICLRPMCREYVGQLTQFGSLLACAQCIHKAVTWAYECATKWGGAYGPYACGDEQKDAMPTTEPKQETWDAAKP